MKTQVQVDALTGVRGVAAWLVVFYHIRESFAASLPAAVTAVFAKGYLAVDLFFILSGFVLWMTWGDRFTADGLRAVPDFLRKRIARVWPLHAAVLTATVVFAITVAASGRSTPVAYRWEELPCHYLLIQNWGFTRTLAWNDPSWSISTEVAAYLLFPAGALALARVPPAMRVSAGIGGAIVLAVLLDRAFALHGYALLGDDIAKMGLSRCILEFACGMMMCMVWQCSDSRRVAPIAGVAIVGLAAAWGGSALRETVAVPLIFSALVVFVAASSTWRGNPLSSRVAVFLGEISYSTYLAHFLLWTLFKIVLVDAVDDVPLTLGALYLGTVLLASVILHRFIEVPARQWLGRAPMPKSRTAST